MAVTSDPVGRQVARALESNETMTLLDLGHNLLGAEAGVALGAALARNKTLRALDLFYNDVRDAGASAVWESTRMHPLYGVGAGKLERPRLGLGRARVRVRPSPTWCQGPMDHSSTRAERRRRLRRRLGIGGWA